jgi:hypothetical protein
LISVVALIEVLESVQLTSPFYLWTTPAWLAWYLVATGNKKKSTDEIGPVQRLPSTE